MTRMRGICRSGYDTKSVILMNQGRVRISHLMSKHVAPLSLTFRLFVTFQLLTSHLEMYACRGVTLDRAFAREAVVFEIVYRMSSSEGWNLRNIFKPCHQCTGSTYLAERRVNFPSTPAIGGTGIVLMASRGCSASPFGMGKTMRFADVTMTI